MIYTVFMAFASVYGLVFSKQIADDKRSRTAYCTIMGLLLFLIAGLRGLVVGGDSGQYARLYQQVARMDWSGVFQKFSDEPLFYLFMKLLTLISTNYTFLFCVAGAIFAYTISRFIYEYSEAPYISYVMLIPMQYYPFTLSGCRQAVAMSIVLFAMMLMFKKSYVKFALLIFIAYFVHNSVIFVIPFILLIFLRKRLISRILFVIGMVFTYIFRNPLLDFITNYVYTDYDIYEDTRGSVTTLLMYLAILLLCMFFVNNPNAFRPSESLIVQSSIESISKYDDPVVREKTTYQYLEVLLGMGVIIQIFVPLQPNIYRAAMYYQIVSLLIVPKIVCSIPNKVVRGLVIGAFYVIMFILYFRFTFYAAQHNPYKFFWQ